MLAAMVLLQHGLLLLPDADKTTFYWLELGAVAVSVFFALSGFVVAEAASSFYAGRPARFLANRALRIVPLYFVVLALTIGLTSWLYADGRLVPLDAPLRGPPWQAGILFAGLMEILPGLPAHRISGQDFSFIPFAWTLRIECVFYLLAALACWPPARRNAGPVAAIGAYVLFGLFLVWHNELPQQMLCIPFFAHGVYSFQTGKYSSLWLQLNLCALMLCAGLAFTYWSQRGHPVLAFQLPLLALLLFAMLSLARCDAASPRLVAWDKRLGALSYPIYIGHGLVLTALRSATDYRGWWLYGAGLIGSLLLAIVLNAYVDRPLRQMRARLRGTAI